MPIQFELMSLLRKEAVQRQMIVLAASIQYFVSTGPVYNYNVFFVDLQQEFMEGAVFTGWVGSLCSALYCCAAPLGAVVGAKIGNLRVVFVGVILASTGYLSTSFIPTLELGFLTFGLMAGVGSGFSIFAAGSLLLDWFSGREDCCRATGAVMIGGSIGVMVFGPLLNTLNASLGWRNCLRILSGIVLVLGLVGALPFLKSAESQSSQLEKAVDEEHELEIIQINEDHQDEGSVETEHSQQTDNGKDLHMISAKESSSNGATFLLKVLLNVEVWLWVFSTTFAQLGWSFVIINYSSFMEEMGLSTKQISVALTVIGAAEIGGKILFVMFGDRLPFLKLYVMAGTTICGAVTSGLQTLCKTFLHIIILSVAWGLARGGIYGTCFAAGDELFRSYGSRVVSSIVLTGFGIGMLIGSSITGVLYDLSGDYTLSLFVLVASFVLSTLSMLLIPARRKMRTSCYGCCRGSPDHHRIHTVTEAGSIEKEPLKQQVGSVKTSNPRRNTNSNTDV